MAGLHVLKPRVWKRMGAGSANDTVGPDMMAQDEADQKAREGFAALAHVTAAVPLSGVSRPDMDALLATAPPLSPERRPQTWRHHGATLARQSA